MQVILSTRHQEVRQKVHLVIEPYYFKYSKIYSIIGVLIVLLGLSVDTRCSLITTAHSALIYSELQKEPNLALVTAVTELCQNKAPKQTIELCHHKK